MKVRYNDNYLNFPEHAPDHVFTIGYEEQFMQMVGYDETFIRPQSVLSPKACDAQRHPPQPAADIWDRDFYPLLLQLMAAATLLLVGLALGVRIGVHWSGERECLRNRHMPENPVRRTRGTRHRPG